MHRKLAFVVLFVVGLSSIAQADERIHIRNDFGNSCSRDTTSGKTLELQTSIDPFSNRSTVQVAFKMELGRKNNKGVDCRQMYRNTLAMEAIELRKAEIELQIMEQKLIGGSTSDAYGDDW